MRRLNTHPLRAQLLVLSMLAAGHAFTATVPAGFTDSIHVAGLTNPTAMQFARQRRSSGIGPNDARAGHCGHSASTTTIKSSSAAKGSRSSHEASVTPPSAARCEVEGTAIGASAKGFEQFIQQCFTIKQAEVVAQLGPINDIAIRAQQGPDVLEVLGSARIVDEALQLEGDQALEADDPHGTERRVATAGLVQQP